MEQFFEENAEDKKLRRKRRSSILKTPKSRSPFCEVEPAADVSSLKIVRRVSFASSNFVKPFVADPDKNTIWDTTYEEAINHTDSTQSSQEQLSAKLNSTLFLQTMQQNPSNVTNFEASEMDLTKLVLDKENIQIPPIMSIVDYARKLSSSSVVPLYNAQTQSSVGFKSSEASSMEFTCQYFNPYLQKNCQTEEYETKVTLREEVAKSTTVNDIDLTCETTVSKTSSLKAEYACRIPKPEDDDMELGCQIPLDETLKVEKTTTDMEFTCQIPDKSKTGKTFASDMELGSQIPTNNTLTAEKSMNMEFTCQIPDKLSKIYKTEQIASNKTLTTEKSMTDMEFTCQIPDKLSKAEKTIAPGMDFTCQIPETEDVSDMELSCQVPANNTLTTEKSINREFTCQIPDKLPKIYKTENSIGQQIASDKTLTTEKSMIDMEFTCQIPAKLLKAEKTIASGMDFTCQIPETEDVSDMELSCQVPANNTLTTEKSINREFTCQIPDKLSKIYKTGNFIGQQTASNKTLTTEKSMIDMEFTCQIPAKLSKAEKTIIASGIDLTCQIPETEDVNDMELSCQVPAYNTLTTEKSINMEFTCQIPDKLSKISKIDQKSCQTPNKTLTTEKSMVDIEFTCQIPDKLSKTEKATPSGMDLTCQIPETENVDDMAISTDNTLTTEKSMTSCQIPDKLSKTGNFIDDLKSCQIPSNKALTTDMEFTCQIPVKLSKTGNFVDDQKLVSCQTPFDKCMNGMERSRQIPDKQQTNIENYTQDDDVFDSTECMEISYAEDQQLSKTEPKKTDRTLSQTTPNSKNSQTRCSTWIPVDTPSKKANKNCATPIERDILFSQKMPKLTPTKNSSYYFKSPSPSFRINLTNISSGVDDTQQLIHCTFTKHHLNSLYASKIEDQVSCNRSLSMKELEHVSAPDINTSEVKRNTSRSSSETSFSQIPENKLSAVNDTYVLKGKTTRKSKETDEIVNLSKEEEPEDMVLQMEESRIGQFETEKSPIFKLMDFDLGIENNRARQEVTQKIQDKRSRVIDFMKRFKFKPIHVPDEFVVPKKNENEEEICTEKKSVPELSLEEKVKEHQKRCQNSWKLEKIDGDCYRFSTLSKIVFTAQVDPADGTVSSLETGNRLTEKSHPISCYITKQFLNKLEDSHVKAAIGEHHDLLSLLDYVQMVSMKAASLREDLMKCYYLDIKRDFTANFTILSEILGLYFTVSFDVSDLENVDSDTAIVIQKFGSVNELEFKSYIKNCPKGWNFFREFCKALEDYLSIKEKRKTGKSNS